MCVLFLIPESRGHRVYMSDLICMIMCSPASCDPRSYASAGGGKEKRGSSNSHLGCIRTDQSDRFNPNFG